MRLWRGDARSSVNRVDAQGSQLRHLASEVSALWVALRSGSQAVEFAAWILLARRLPTDAVGVISIAYLLCRYAGLIADLAGPFAGVRMIARGQTQRDIAAYARARERLTIVLTLTGAATLALADPRLVALFPVIAYRGANRDWIALGEGRQAASAMPPLLAASSLMVGAIFTPTLLGFSLVAGSGHLVALALSTWATPALRNPGPLAPALRSASWMTLAILGDQLYQSSDIFLIGFLIGAEEAGIYATLYRFPSAWVALVGLLSSGWLRSAAARSVTEGGIAANIRQALRAGRVAAVGVIVLLPAVYWLVPALLGSPFDEHREVALVLALSGGLATMAAPLSTVYMTARSDRGLAAVTALVGLGNLGCCLLLLPHFGLIAAALTTVASYLVLVLYYTASLKGGSTSLAGDISA